MFLLLFCFVGDDDAQYYEIEYHNNYKLITDHRNEQKYYLVQCGTQPPAGLDANAIIHQVPVTNVAALETTVVPYLEVSIVFIYLFTFVPVNKKKWKVNAHSLFFSYTCFVDARCR